MNQEDAPLYEAVINRAKRKLISFQTPGHNNGLAFDNKIKRDIKDNFFYLDVSVCGKVDSLDSPKTFIRDSQRLLAKAYGVDNSYFLVGGSTLGNQIMFLSAFSAGDKVIIPRNVHKSILSSIIISGVVPIWIYPELSENKNITYNVLSSQIKDALDKHPDAKGVSITSPTYHGIVADLEKINNIIKEKNKILIVDESWGAHLKFHPKFPKSATEIGVDMCVQSFHKMLPALNQSSILHINTKNIDYTKVERAINLLQTTSPSYPMLAIMDYTRRNMALNGKKILSEILLISKEIKQKLTKIGISTLLDTHVQNGSGEFTLDPAKVTIFTNEIGITGYELEKILDEEYGIQVECSNYDNIIIILKYGNLKFDVKQLIKALTGIINNKKMNKTNKINFEFNLFNNDQVIEPRKAFFSKELWIDLDNSKGKICAETISVYPPGIPILIPGERISKEVIEYLITVKSKGGTISSLDPDLKRIKVVQI